MDVLAQLLKQGLHARVSIELDVAPQWRGFVHRWIDWLLLRDALDPVSKVRLERSRFE